MNKSKENQSRLDGRLFLIEKEVEICENLKSMFRLSSKLKTPPMIKLLQIMRLTLLNACAIRKVHGQVSHLNL